MAQDRILGEQVDIVDISADMAANPTAIGNLATGITNDPGASASLDIDYVRRDGTTSMSGVLTVNNNIVTTGTVDGRDVALDGSTQDTHIGDTSLHFTVASINHASILSIGTNTHAQIDTHISDATQHFLETSISHANITNIGVNTHTAIDAHVGDNTIHFSSISGLSDVDTTGATVGQVLTYSNSPMGWFPQDAPAGGGGLSSPLTADLDTGGFDIRAADFSSGEGVDLTLRGGYSTNTSNRSLPSNVLINGGNSQYTSGGDVLITGGTSSTKPAGDITITGGYSTGAASGAVSLIAGETAGVGYKGAGNARVYGGNSTGLSTPAGDVILSGGDASGIGSPQEGSTGGNINMIPGYGVDGSGVVNIRAPRTSIGQITGEGILRITKDSNSIVGSVGLTIPSSTASHIVFTLPNTDGIDGDVLQTDGIGNLTFATPSGGGGSSNNWLTANNGIDFSKGPYASTGAIALGDSTSTYGDNAIAIGNAAYAGTPGSPIAPSMAIALGYSASATLTTAIALGSYATVSGNYSTGIGISATVSGNYSTGVGLSTTVSGSYSVGFGNGCNAAHSYSATFGYYCYSGADNQTNVGVGIQGDATAYRSTFGYGANNPVGTGTGQNLVTIYDGGKVEPIGDTAMFVAPTYTLATLPPAVVGGMIYVTDATTTGATGVQCFGREVGSPPAGSWIDIITGLTVV